jgi:hypothetical protein
VGDPHHTPRHSGDPVGTRVRGAQSLTVLLNLYGCGGKADAADNCSGARVAPVSPISK